MKKSYTYRLNDVTIAQLERMQNHYQWTATELIEKAVDILDQLYINHQIGVDFLVRLPNTEDMFFCKKI